MCWSFLIRCEVCYYILISTYGGLLPLTNGSVVSSSGQWDLGLWKLCNEMFNPLGVTGCVFAFLALLLSTLIIGRLWTKPRVLAIHLAVITLLPFGCCLTNFLVDCLC